MPSKTQQLIEAIAALESPEAQIEAIEGAREALHEISPLQSQPVDYVRWVPLDWVTPNDYNPNSVAGKEMGLLYTSIWQDGYTQPIVTVYNPESELYEIVDGFHRNFTCLSNDDVLARNHGCLPIVVIDKEINDRMAATVRHNRARGQHSVAGMGSMVFKMLDEGWADEEICNNLGMEPEELLRLKHVTGFSKLYENAEYRKSWETKAQIQLRIEAEKSGSTEAVPE